MYLGYKRWTSKAHEEFFYFRKFMFGSWDIQFFRVLNHPLNFQFVGSKAKGRISNWVFQENKACRVFRKLNISYPLIRTFTFSLPVFGSYPLLKYFKSAIKIFYKLSQITKLYLIGCLKMWDRSSKGILLIIST